MITPKQIKKFKDLFPEHAAANDEAIIKLIESIYGKLQAKAQAAIASFDDNDECSSAPPMRTKSVAAPTKVELMVTAMSQEAREDFLRDFAQTAPDLPSCRADGVSSDPGPHGARDSSLSDTVASSR